MSRVLNTVVELIRVEDKLELLHMNFIFKVHIYEVIRVCLLILYIYIYIYTQVSSLESYMSRVLNTVVELIRLEDKLELLHMNFISLQICFV